MHEEENQTAVRTAIRTALPEDVHQLIALSRMHLAETKATSLTGFDEAHLVDKFFDALSNDYEQILVAEKGGSIIGYLWVCIGQAYVWSEQTLGLDRVLYVDDKERGRVGILLIKRFEQWAAKMGASGCTLSSMSGITDERTSGLFKLLGYDDIGFSNLKLFNPTDNATNNLTDKE